MKMMRMRDLAMRPMVLVTALLALLAVEYGVANAGSDGVAKLAWSDCGAAGTSNQDFTCDTNDGEQVLVLSFVMNRDLPLYKGVTVNLRVVPGAGLLDWWALDVCRLGVASHSVDFASMTACDDPMQGLGEILPVMFFPRSDIRPNELRVHLSARLPNGDETPVTAGVEYYATKLLLSNALTIGTLQCAGCDTGAEIFVDFFEVSEALGGPNTRGFQLVDPLNPVSVTWQGGVVPVHGKTWGQIKSLYR